MLQVDIDELRRLATTVTSVGAEIDKIDVRTNLNRAFSQFQKGHLADGVNGADALRIDAYLNSHDLKATVGQYQTAHGTEAALGLGTDYYKLVAKRTENQGTTDNQDEK
ncbi:hypothetical protein [Nocardia asteroides]|uniref:hypothetical protein n=1 Tax=Nocardia asteroides TaxID=1824 RepID=UPI0033F29DF3